jgi:hypothetical protein
MAKISIDQLRALPDYAQATKWNVVFITLPTLGPFTLGTTDALNLRTTKIDQPKAKINNFEVQVRGHKTIHPGIIDYGNEFKITFTETVDSAIYKLIQAWREIMWSSRQGQAFAKADVEATILLELLDNEDNVRAQTTYYGCMYKDHTPGELDGSTSDALKPDLTLSYDFFIDNPIIL